MIRRTLMPPPTWEDGDRRQDPDRDAWLLIYLDVFTLMLSVFVMLLSYTTFSPEKFKALTQALSSQPLEAAQQAESVIAEPIELKAQEPAAVEVPAPLSEEGEKETVAVIEKPAEAATEQLRDEFQRALLNQQLEDQVEVTIESNRVNLQIRESILFDLGQADLSPGGEGVLARLVALLNSGANNVSVEGHTDPTPISNQRFPSNWELSTQRATRVLRFLAAQGVPAERMRAIGYADTRPIADNTTPEGRARNRRVSLVVHLLEE
ncbi:MAG: flagellar motor protein MotB [Sedimenticola sp.]|nr:MAG: flagellar motor protein MotB [Sedimenticola sp.]